jgi:hypothetical protein
MRFGAALAVLAVLAALAAGPACLADQGLGKPAMQRRWLFVWRDINDPKEVDRVIARLPAAHRAGYNGVALSANVAPDRAAALRQAAKLNGIDLVAIVMGNSRDRNNMGGVPVRDALYLVKEGVARLEQDNPTRVANGGFEAEAGDRAVGWGWQDDEGVTTFIDREVMRSGRSSLRMEAIGKNQYRHCRVSQPVKLQPRRQYHVSVWVKTEDLAPADPEIKLLTRDGASLSFQTFRVDRTQDWKCYDIVFNSFDATEANLYLGSWGGKEGKLWWDDLAIEEIGLVNVLRRPGCPVAVRGEGGTAYEEGRDFQRIVDPVLHPWIAYHEQPPIRLAAGTRIREGERLRVSWYHSIVVYEDRLNSCLSEPAIFEEWRREVKAADALLHPAAFLMSHDEIRVINQCALCRGRNLTPGQILADNVRKAAAIIRQARPDAGIWVWNDMFDPMHNAVEKFYAVNGTLAGSWKGLDKDVGIVNWHGGLEGKNCRFFADLGLKQILSGYYDGDDDGAAITRWKAATRDIPGIVGAMYTTWEDKYGAMEAWAKAAWGGGGEQ